MHGLAEAEKAWLSKVAPKKELSQLLTLPGDMVRVLYPDVFNFGPHGSRIRTAVTYFGEHMDSLESFEKLMFSSMVQYTPLITMKRDPEYAYLERIFSSVHSLVEEQDAVKDYEDQTALFGIGCALLGDNVLPEDSMAEVQRYQLAPVIMDRCKKEGLKL